MKEFIMTTYTIVLPVLLSDIVWILKPQKKDRAASSKGIMLLLRAQLKSCHKEYMERKKITSAELEDYLEVYNAYHTLKGNGVATRWKEEVEKLPVVD